jgi:chromosome segregation ATPase
MNAAITKIRLIRLSAVLFAGSCTVAYAQQATPIPAPKQDQPAVEDARPIIPEKEVQQYGDLARQLVEEVDKLVRRGLRDAADEVQRRLDQAGGEPRHDGADRERVEHLLQAAEHLSQAGMEDEALKLRKQAEELSKKDVAHPEELERLRKRVDQLERTIQALKDENRELRRLIPQRPL